MEGDRERLSLFVQVNGTKLWLSIFPFFYFARFVVFPTFMIVFYTFMFLFCLDCNVFLFCSALYF